MSNNSEEVLVGGEELKMLETCGSITVAINFILMLLIVASNCAILYVTMRFPRLHTTTNVFVASLASADLFLGLVIPFLLYISWPGTTHWHLLFARPPCLAMIFLFSLPLTSSVFTLLFLAIERYVSLRSPSFYLHQLTRRRAIAIATLPWLYAIANCTVAIYQVEWDGVVGCVYEHIMASAYLVTNSIILLLAIIATITIYIVICFTHKETGDKDNQHITTMMFLVVIAFVVTWLPNLIFTLLSEAGHIPEAIHVTIIRMFFSVLIHINSCINPAIYAWRNETFRKAFKQILACRWKPDADMLELQINMEHENGGNTNDKK